MGNIVLPPDAWDPRCPECGRELEIDDGNGLLECPIRKGGCGWSERNSKASVCGKCSSKISREEERRNKGYCDRCTKSLKKEMNR